MAKIVKNTTISAIELVSVGVTIPASGQYEINQKEFLEWASDDLATEITSYLTSGDLVINDGVNDLSLTEGLYYLRYPDWAFNTRFLDDTIRSNGFVSKNVQEAIEESKITVAGKLLDFDFSSTGNTANKWLNVGHPSAPSDAVPFVCAWGGTVEALSYANSNDLSDTDLQFYVNGSLQYTWEIRDKRTAWIVSSGGLFTVAQGDRISIYASKITGGDTPSNPTGSILVQTLAMGNGSGGTASGV